MKKPAQQMIKPGLYEDELIQAVYAICMKSRSSRLLCRIHRRATDVSDDCDICVDVRYCHGNPG